MLQIVSFTFNPFYENTYLLVNELNQCIIIDPGMYNASEQKLFTEYIIENRLNPIKLVNTHCHIDHILGNTYCSQKWNLDLICHRLELPILESGRQSALLFGLQYEESVMPSEYIDEKDLLEFGTDQLKILFTPGHSPGSISFYSEREGFIISGDVLFQNSIGRTDLPGGDYSTLLKSISEKLMILPDETVVYSGHGPETTIGNEKMYNPFLRDLR